MDRAIVRQNRCGFTLIELLLVVAILAILTAVILPKFDGVQSKANHGVGAASADDTGRLIVTYKVTKNKYPNGWDSLLDASGNPWTAADPTQPGVHTQLFNTPVTTSSGPKLKVITLTGNQVASLSRMGISKIFTLGTVTSALPGDRFNVASTLTDGSKVCAIDGTGNGKKMIDSIYPQNKVSTGVSGTLPTGKEVVVFGLGPLNDMIGTSMTDVPFYPNVDLTLVYNRNLVAFEVDANGGRADFKGVFGTDGDLKSDMANTMFK